jgi:GTP-binding protein HflX
MPDALCVSAKTGMGLGALHDAVMDRYQGGMVRVVVVSPMSRGKVQSFLRANAEIIHEEYMESSVKIEARIGKNQIADLKRLGPETLEIKN